MVEFDNQKTKKGITYVFKHFPKIDAEYVKALRHKLGLPQWLFASLMRVSIKTVEKWEQGKNPVTNGNAVAMVLFDRNPSLIETFIGVEEGICEPNFDNMEETDEEYIPQELKLANAK